MYWQVFIPKEGSDQLSAPVTVEADNWFSALRNGLDKHGLDGKLVSNLSCSIDPDQTVTVTDFVTKRVFTLKPMDGSEAAEQSEPIVPAPAPQQKTVAEAAAPVPLTGDFSPHQIFFLRDEAPDDGSGIYYRERLLAVQPGYPKDEASRLVLAYFKDLKEKGSPDGTKLFIQVQVFDHAFEEQSLRPAVASLTWKGWSPKKPKILFPLSGEAGVTFSKVPPPPAVSEQASKQPVQAVPAQEVEPKQPEPEPEKKQVEPKQPEPATEKKIDTPSKSEPAPTPKVQQQPLETTVDIEAKKHEVEPKRFDIEPKKQQVKPIEPAPKSSEPREAKTSPRRKRQRTPALTPPPQKMAVEEKMVEAFERMQDIYDVRTHDGAAAFALSLARDLIKCEAGSSMLITPGKYELYVSAAEGPVADSLKGKKMSFRKGIVGFATRSSVVVNVKDPANDSRFDSKIDEMNEFETKSVLCAPIQFEGRTRGAIELINSARKEGFAQADANILSYLGSALAEYITTSLPSRQADFSDKEFLEPVRPSRGPAKKKTTPSRAPAKKVSPEKTPVKTESKSAQPVAKKEPEKEEASKPEGSPAKKKASKGKKSKKKKKRRR